MFLGQIVLIFFVIVYNFYRVIKGENMNEGEKIARNPLDQREEVLEHLKKKDKRMVVAMAPSVRVAIGEGFGGKIGENNEGKIISAFRRLGFDDVFDVDFGADMTVVEESNEFVERFLSGKNLPMFTSCCPAWVKFVEQNYPEYVKNLSTCKSPQQMLGAVVKTYYAEKLGVTADKLYFVSVMPCIAKKMERQRDFMSSTPFGLDTDAVITASEMIDMIKEQNIDFNSLPKGRFDSAFGTSSGSGVIFGTTGGVMEASLRTLSDKLGGKRIKKVEYLLVRGVGGIREATVNIGDKKVRIAVASGLMNAKTLMDDIKAGKKYYDFVEVMACSGGCSNGTGMPIYFKNQRANEKVAMRRARGLYKSDATKRARKAHENPAIKSLYQNFLGEIGGEKAKQLLHTHYSQHERTV